MAPPASTPKIEELRFRLKTDPKSRLFYPLAEELRKVGSYAEAEQVLRTGLTHHPTYLSAWVGLGRVAREEAKHDDAIEALSKALQLDPGNIVAARLLADSYLAAGEKVEAIKKYKLVHALMPGDNDVEATIAQLERELTPITPAPLEPEPEPEPEPFVEEPRSAAEEAILSGDAEPMLAAHEESPFEEPVADFTAAAVEVEAPQGMHIEEAPLGAETATPWDEEPADVFAATEEEPQEAPPPPPPAPPAPPAAAAEPTETVTMADLYARQGLASDARRIYESILQREPSNDAVREKLAALQDDGNARKVARLEEWLSKVGRREDSRV